MDLVEDTRERHATNGKVAYSQSSVCTGQVQLRNITSPENRRGATQR
jgi:hypothetical protein